LFAGQISGVEGYVECIATGLVAGLNAVCLASGNSLLVPPRTTAIGSLIHYLVSADPENFQPENINFGIMPPPQACQENKRMGKKEKHLLQAQQALKAIAELAESVRIEMKAHIAGNAGIFASVPGLQA
jgi:methylenetetrahydrofolate--tRNA-(uracil-5-)-methyltransferase